MEIERMKEEEEARRREQMRKNELQGMRDQEEKFAATNRLKILNQWRKLMRLVKVEDNELRRHCRRTVDVVG